MIEKGFILLVRKFAAVTAMASAIVLGSSSIAWGHECTNVSRSANGNTGAAGSNAWATVTVQDISGFVGLSGTQADCFVAYWLSHGGPASIVVHSTPSVNGVAVIAENNPNTALFSNGRGIDHAEDVFGPLVGAAVGACVA